MLPCLDFRLVSPQKNSLFLVFLGVKFGAGVHWFSCCMYVAIFRCQSTVSQSIREGNDSWIPTNSAVYANIP